MQFHKDTDLAAYSIHSYHHDGIEIRLPVDPQATEAPVIRREKLTTSFIISPTQLIRNWEPRKTNALERRHLEIILSFEPEIVIIATGKRIEFLDPSTTADLINQSIGFEIMDNAAACRTYNILMTEGRRIATAFIIGP